MGFEQTYYEPRIPRSFAKNLLWPAVGFLAGQPIVRELIPRLGMNQIRRLFNQTEAIDQSHLVDNGVRFTQLEEKLSTLNSGTVMNIVQGSLIAINAIGHAITLESTTREDTSHLNPTEKILRWFDEPAKNKLQAVVQDIWSSTRFAAPYLMTKLIPLTIMASNDLTKYQENLLPSTLILAISALGLLQTVHSTVKIGLKIKELDASKASRRNPLPRIIRLNGRSAKTNVTPGENLTEIRSRLYEDLIIKRKEEIYNLLIRKLEKLEKLPLYDLTDDSSGINKLAELFTKGDRFASLILDEVIKKLETGNWPSENSVNALHELYQKKF